MSGSNSQPPSQSSPFRQYIIAFEGASLGCILYGVYLALSGMNLSLLQKKRYGRLWWFSVLQLAATTVIFGLMMYYIPLQCLGIFGINDFYGLNDMSPWFMVITDVIFVLNTWASDAFLLYRCYTICAANKYALAGPALLYLIIIGSSTAWLVVGSTPGATYSTRAVQVTGVSCWSCSAAVNVCASLLISVRLYGYRQAMFRAAGSPQGTFYLSYISMTLESAFLYTVSIVITLVAFALNSPFVSLFFPMLCVIQVIATSLIINRIARGISIERDESGTISTGARRCASEIIRRQRCHIITVTSDVLNVTPGDTTKPDDTDLFIHQQINMSVIQ